MQKNSQKKNEAQGKKVKEKRTRLGFRSIRNKLVLLGAVAVFAALILGVTGIYLINSSNANNKVLEDINNVNLYQNENQTLDVSFLYNLDNSDNEKIVENLNKMTEASTDALKYADVSSEKELQAIADDVAQNLENMNSLVELFGKRGFTDADGMYKDFMAQDASLAETFGKMNAEGEWLDGSWNPADVSTFEVVEIGGAAYRYGTYSRDLTDGVKRNFVVARIGGNGMLYTGKVYITNIKFDDSVKVDMSGLEIADLSKSYGGGYTDLAIVDFNGDKAISYQGNFPGGTDWVEASIEVPISAYEVQDFGKVSFDVYFEDMEVQNAEMAIALSQKYDFESNLSSLNSMFLSYSKSVAEGLDVAEQQTLILDRISEMKKAVDAYTADKTVAKAGVDALAAKEEAFNSIISMDEQIIKLKEENNTLNTNMTASISAVRDAIEKQTETSRNVMMTLIIVVCVVSVILIFVLTIFVIASVQKSIKRFKVTLQTISEGNITAKAVTGRGDEFDVFGQSLNQMTDKLTDTLQTVVGAAGDLKESSAELEKMAQLTSQTSSQMEYSVAGISEGANDQAQDVEQSTSRINDLGNLMEEMVSDVNELDETSVSMKAAGDEAGQILDALSVSNTKMTEGISKIAEQISTTNNSVVEIKDAVSLISSIASQTNLLSLNASIEAARAGEAGKGFAVVAMEIQKLAEQSNNSADTIYQVIANLTNEFQQTMQVMDEVQNATHEQNQKLSETQHQFEIVGEGITSFRNKTAFIKESIKQCNDVRIDVSSLMLNLSAISEENAASATETAESMQILNNTINELLKASEKLNEISMKLEEDMSFFVL